MFGIPTIEDYKAAINSKEFSEMERFSDEFLKKNFEFRIKKWISDPLHQWSRQWEYSFVFKEIQIFSRNRANLHILDAGSGITFFPYYLANSIPGCNIKCCDNDKKLVNLFPEILNDNVNAVSFDLVNLHNLSYSDGFFDIIYCISVLEHTNDYDSIIKQFKRILKPGGLLIITFDISLDGDRDIPISKAEKLLDMLCKFFSKTEPINKPITKIIENKNILTTKYAKKNDKKLLPWKSSRSQKLKHFIKKQTFSEFYNLTCFTGAFINK